MEAVEAISRTAVCPLFFMLLIARISHNTLSLPILVVFTLTLVSLGCPTERPQKLTFKGDGKDIRGIYDV